MNKSFRYFLLTLLALLGTGVVTASEVFYGGLCFEIQDDGTAVVARNDAHSALSGTVDIPAVINDNGDEYDVTGVGYRAFATCTGITTINLPSSITEIGNYAFTGCTNLATLNFANPAALRMVGYHALVSTKWLADQPEGLVTIGKLVVGYSGRAPAGSVIAVPEGITTICDGAFSNQDGITGITFPSTLTTIGSKAFESCTSLEAVTLPKKVSAVDVTAFQSSLVTDIHVADGNKTYSDIDGVLCDTYKKVLIIYPSARVATVYEVPSSILTIGTRAFNVSALTTIQLNPGLTTIEAEAFSGSKHLTSVVFPHTMRNLGERAFAQCTALTDIDLNLRLQVIGDEAFSNCLKLRNITCRARTPYVINSTHFNGVDKERANIYVPYGKLQVYASAEGWNEFLQGCFHEMDKEEVYGDVNGDGEVNVTDINIVISIILNNDAY